MLTETWVVPLTRDNNLLVCNLLHKECPVPAVYICTHCQKSQAERKGGPRTLLRSRVVTGMLSKDIRTRYRFLIMFFIFCMVRSASHACSRHEQGN
jgi:hypothetical protein